jgi:hypothetical protein
MLTCTLSKQLMQRDLRDYLETGDERYVFLGLALHLDLCTISTDHYWYLPLLDYEKSY